MITSLHNPRILRARRLLRRQFRTDQRSFLVEGSRAVAEALDAQAPLETVFIDPARGAEISGIGARAASQSIPVTEVSPAVMRSMSGHTTAPGVLAVCTFIDTDPRELLERQLSLVTVLGSVRDPGNAGTIIRASRAAGVDGIFVADETVDIYNPKLVRATAGALFSVPITRDVPLRWVLDELGRSRINRIAADAKGEAVYDQIDMTVPTALIAGNEAWGLPPFGPHDPVDVIASIPMKRSSESLNVAIAAAVILFEAARQRRVVGAT